MTRRFAWFDCLRCAAVALVLMAHCGNMSHLFSPAVAPILVNIQSIGWVGVDLFFVLSGFLVSGLLFDEHDAHGQIDLRRFLVRRGFKIIPPFYFLLLVTLMVDLACHLKLNPQHFLDDVTFFQSYGAGNWPHAWTLAVEIHFYILLGLLLYFLARRPPAKGSWLKNLPLILGCVLVVSPVLRFIHSSARHTGFKYEREIEPSHLHLDVLAAGVLLRYLYTYRAETLAFLRPGRFFWIILGLLLVWPSEFLSTPNHPAIVTALIPTANLLGFGLILFQATQMAFPRTGPVHWLVKPFDYLGKHSYSIYLWHLPIREWIFWPLLKGHIGVYLFAYFIGSLAVGCLFSVALEMPVLHLRNLLFPSRATANSVPSGPATIIEPPPEEAAPDG